MDGSFELLIKRPPRHFVWKWIVIGVVVGRESSGIVIYEGFADFRLFPASNLFRWPGGCTG